MARTAVIYQSRYGHARDYAGWIADALEADLFAGAKPDKLESYDTLIFGGGLYAGGIGGASFLRENFERFRGRQLVVFTVGLTSPGEAGQFGPIIDRAFPDAAMREQIRFFHLRGGIDYKHLSFGHRAAMGVLRMMLKGKKERSHQDEIILETYGARVDFRDKASIAPIVQYVRGQQKEEV